MAKELNFFIDQPLNDEVALVDLGLIKILLVLFQKLICFLLVYVAVKIKPSIQLHAQWGNLAFWSCGYDNFTSFGHNLETVVKKKVFEALRTVTEAVKPY